MYTVRLSQQHKHCYQQTKIHQKFILPFYRTNIDKSSSEYQEINTWNNTLEDPQNIKGSVTIGIFAKKLKMLLLE